MKNTIKILIAFSIILCILSCENTQNIEDNNTTPLFSIENKNYWVYQKIIDSVLVNTQTYSLKRMDTTWVLKLSSSSKPIYNDSVLIEFYYKGNVLYILDYYNLMCTGQKKYYYKEITPNTVEYYSPNYYIFKMRNMGCIMNATINHEIFSFTPNLGLTRIEKKLQEYNSNQLKTVYSLVLVESGYK